MRRLLAVTAHPDDESGAFGGTLSLYADRGVETSVLCLTPGQAGSRRGAATSQTELALMRRKEFADACKILGVTHAIALDYEDGGLYRADLYRAVGDIARYIRELRPHVVIAMGPEGTVTAHPDHSMASIFATLAYHWAGRDSFFPEQLQQGLQPHRAQKLYYLTAPAALPQRAAVCLPPITATIPISAFVERKIAAFRAHKTQGPLSAFFEEHVLRAGGSESYHLAAHITPRRATLETDLFEGIAEEPSNDSGHIR